MEKLKIEFIRAEFAKEGYTLLTEVYENNRQKLEYICSSPERHKHSISWREWQSDNRCPYCNGNAKLNIEFIRAEFKKEGYELLTKIYENAHQKLEYICSEGHNCSITWGHWQQGQRCPFCNQLTIEKVKKLAVEVGIWEVIDDHYDNTTTKLKCKCIKSGHHHMIDWNHILRGTGCPKCNSINISLFEKTVRDFLTESNIDYTSNDRTQLLNPETGYNLELDMWFPDLNKAIECNGVYWHGKKRAIKNDKIKQQLCEDQGIDLLVITDEEWKDDTDKCKNKIQEFLC